jgi:hypothetical protein
MEEKIWDRLWMTKKIMTRIASAKNAIETLMWGGVTQ